MGGWVGPWDAKEVGGRPSADRERIFRFVSGVWLAVAEERPERGVEEEARSVKCSLG